MTDQLVMKLQVITMKLGVLDQLVMKLQVLKCMRANVLHPYKTPSRLDREMDVEIAELEEEIRHLRLCESVLES